MENTTAWNEKIKRAEKRADSLRWVSEYGDDMDMISAFKILFFDIKKRNDLNFWLGFTYHGDDRTGRSRYYIHYNVIGANTIDHWEKRFDSGHLSDEGLISFITFWKKNK